MWIRRLTLTNYRGFEHLDLDLDRPLTVLVGVNGAGKSSVLDAIATAVAIQMSALVSTEIGGRSLREDDLRQGTPVVSVALDARHEGTEFTTVIAGKVDPVDGFEASHRVEDPRRSSRALVTLPLALHVRSPRATDATTAGSAAAARRQRPALAALDDALDGSLFAFAPFVAWYREQEDLENERRRDGEPEHQDPQLYAVRGALRLVAPEYTDLRVRRLPTPHLTVKKSGVTLSLSQLSDGEQRLIALVADIARRMAIADPGASNPLAVEAVILLDEVEQHLHPALQREVLPRLTRAFPKAQLIVTTHSPQVLSSVPASAVVLLDGFAARGLATTTEGRDTNAILRDVFGVPERPQAQRDEVRAIRAMLEEGHIEDARARLEALAAALSEEDDDVVALRMRVHVAEAAE